MQSFDDIFNSRQASENQPEKEFVPFDKEEWKQQKRREREKAYELIDSTALRARDSGELFRTCLEVQSRFDRYSVGNALLITAQKPDATRLADFDTWKDSGAHIKKGEVGIVLLEPGEEYTKEDGSVGVSFNTKKVFDVSQTTAAAKAKNEVKLDGRLLLKALIHGAPCKFSITDKLKSGTNAVYRPDDRTIYVRAGLDAPELFRSVCYELAHAHLDKGEYKRGDAAFTAYCAAFILCSRWDMAKDKFRFETLPESLSAADAGAVRAELGKIRSLANEISADMAKVLDSAQRTTKETPERGGEAR